LTVPYVDWKKARRHQLSPLVHRQKYKHSMSSSFSLVAIYYQKSLRLQKTTINWQWPMLIEKKQDDTNFRHWFIQDPNSLEKLFLCSNINIPIKTSSIHEYSIWYLEECLKRRCTLNSASGQALWRSQADIMGQQTS